MSVRQYTSAQLLALRKSPLVHKPDELPSIEQWIDESMQHTHTERQQSAVPGVKENKRNRLPPTSTAADASPMGAFSTGRPTLGTRNSTLRGATGDDISLGPPKTVFASSRNNSKLADGGVSSGDAAPVDDAESARSKSWFADRQASRRSGVADKDSRDARDSWTRAAERKALSAEDDSKADKNDRYGRHDTQDGERRNGYGEKGDPRWNINRGEERRQNGDRPTGGWRDREQARRNGDRGHDEREPEWMDDPVVKKDQELNFGMAHTQEEFQKWKEGMNRKNKGEPESHSTPLGDDHKEDVVVAAPSAPPEPKPSLKLDGFEGGFFGGFNNPSGLPTPTPATPLGSASTTKVPGKGKTSRFASMFKPAAEEPPPPPSESDLQKAANGIAKTSAEDQEGFNRVLQMLGGSTLKTGGLPTPSAESPAPASAPQSPPQPMRSGKDGSGSKPKSRFTNLFEAKSPEGGVQLDAEPIIDNGGRGLTDEPAAILSGRSEQPRARQEPTMSPEPSNMFNVLREQQVRSASSRVNELSAFDPPSRSAASPDINIQNLLAQQRQRTQHTTSNESQQLLNLLKKSDPSQQQSRPSSQQTGGGMGPAELQRWLDHQQHTNSHAGISGPHGVETYAPKPARMQQQPPGLFEEQLMRNFVSREDLGGREQQMPPGMGGEARRQRPPPGFIDEREMMMLQQQQQLHQQQQQQQMQARRNYAEPPQQMPPQQQQVRRHQTVPSLGHQQFQGDYHITSPSISSGGGGGPPGFNPHMPRHPPGFGPSGNPNQFMQQQQQQQQQREPSVGSMPLGFGPQANAPPPPGFFGIPPGFQSMRSPTEGGLPPGMRGGGQRAFDMYEMGRR